MAMYHLRVKYVQRSKNDRSVVAAAAYRSGEKLYDERRDITHDYTRKQDVEHSEIILPAGVPEWLRDREKLWNTVELGIKRKDGQPAIELEAALPRELSPEKCRELATEFLRAMFTDRGLVVDLSIHRHAASDGGEHPHMHLLIGTRRMEPDGSVGRAATDVQDNPALLRKAYALEQEGKVDEALMVAKGTNLIHWRKEWADYSNRFLEDSGSEARIDHRTLQAQKIAREATPNIGLAYRKEIVGIRGWLARKVDSFKAISFRNRMREQADTIDRRKPHLMAEFLANVWEYAKELHDELTPEQDREKEVEYER